MRSFLAGIALALSLGGQAAADGSMAHNFVIDAPYGIPVVDADVAAKPAGLWTETIVVRADSISLHFQDVVLDEGESIVVACSNPDLTVSYDAAAGSEFWTPVMDGGRVEILLQNRDGGRTSFRVPEAVLGYNSLDSIAAKRARVASEERLTVGPRVRRDATAKAVYGSDDRIEAYQSPDAGLRNVAKSTCLVVMKDELTNNGNGTYRLTTTPFAHAGYFDIQGRVCAPENFFNDKRAGFCTGFFVGGDVLVTAGHCFPVEDRENVAFVFDFEMNSQGEVRTTFSADQVYFAKWIIDQGNGVNTNFCVLNADRPITGRNALPIRRLGTIATGAPLAVVGYPEGLPVKIAPAAVVKNNLPSMGYFQANLDSNKFGGSGSPVVDTTTYVVEGIAVRGTTDFIFVSSGTCLVSTKVTDSLGSPYGDYVWQEVTKSTAWQFLVPPVSFTPTPTMIPSPTAIPTVSPEPSPSFTPTPTPIPTASPSPTVSPIPTISPTPQARAHFDFESTPENWANASVGGFVAPNFSQRDGALILAVTDNQNTFGYWQLGTLKITPDGSGTGKDPAIIGTNGPDSLYRATVRLSGTEANGMIAPTVRMRASAGSNEQTSELMVSSATGTYSIAPAAKNFVQFFSQPTNQTRIRLAVDVLNVGGADTASCEVRVESVLVEAMTKSALTGEVKELDRSLAADRVWTYGNAGGGYLAPFFDRTAEGLQIKGMDVERPTSVVIGFWSSARGQDKVILTAGRIYRADFTLATTAPATQRTLLPTIRLRANDSSFNTAVLTNIESVNGNVVLPSSDGGPVVRSVYYAAPAGLAGNYLRYSLDYIWSPLLDNDPAIPITLQKLEVYSYDPIP